MTCKNLRDPEVCGWQTSGSLRFDMLRLSLLPFSHPNVYKTRLSGQLFLLHRQKPSHGNLWISPPVSVSHQLHRRFYVIGRSHCPGRPTLGVKLAKLFCCEPQQIQGGIEIPVNHQPTDQALIGAVLEGHALFDMPTA